MTGVPNPEEQNDQLLRLIAANKVRLAKLQQTIADLQLRTELTGETAHFWEKAPRSIARAELETPPPGKTTR